MRITWSLPVPGETLDSARGDIVRARHLIEALRAEGHQVDVVQAAGRPGTAAAVSGYRSLLKRLVPAAAPVLRDIGRLALGRAHARRVASAARDEGADVIIETQVHLVASGARAGRRSGVPLILDDCSPPTEEAALGRGLARLAGPLFRRQAAAATALAVSSRALARRLEEEGAPKEKLRVVPNAADATRFDGADREDVRRRYDLGDRLTLVYMGSFQPWHRVDLLVDALPRMDPSVRLLLVGDGAGREAALARAAELGVADRIVAPGALAGRRMADALAAGDIAVLPGTNDYGQPMKLLDYAAAGLPAVAPDLPPVREVLEPGVTGLLFPPGDRDGLVAAIARLVGDDDLRRRMAAAARSAARAESRSWRAAARALVAGPPVAPAGPDEESGP